MNRRVLSGLVAALALVALVGQSVRATTRLRGSRLLKLVDAMTPQAVRAGAAGRPLIARQLQLLREAEKADPASVALVVAEAAQLFLLGRLDEAEVAYRRALAMEPRAETWLNLGRTLWQKGNHAEAKEAFARASALAPRLADQIPAGGLDRADEDPSS